MKKIFLKEGEDDGKELERTRISGLVNVTEAWRRFFFNAHVASPPTSVILFFMSLESFNFLEMNITVNSLAKIAAVYYNACHKPCRDLRVHNRAADGTVNFYYRL